VTEQKQEVRNVFKEKSQFIEIDIEFVIQDEDQKKVEIPEEKEEIFVFSPRITHKERRKDRKSRAKSFIQVNHPQIRHEFTITERKTFR
jgi:hypothetical protein